MEIDKLKQGNVKALFPMLGMVVYANGCKCELVSVSLSGSHKGKVVDQMGTPYQVGNLINIDSFLIHDEETHPRRQA